MRKIYDVIIIGGGAAGLGLGKKLQELEIDYLILEKNEIGSSFSKWPDYTRFISPSFPSNAFGQTDLNSLDSESSPGVFSGKEHPSGKDYAEYLQGFSDFYDMNVKEHAQVESIEKKDDIFDIHTSTDVYTTKFLCCAIGEFSFPCYGDIEGYEHSLHSSKFKNTELFENTSCTIPVIGGYESAIDAAYSLVQAGKKVHIFSGELIDDEDTTDPSVRLSLYSLERYKKMQQSGLLTVTSAHIQKISCSDGTYTLFGDGEEYVFQNQPITATGFQSKVKILGDFVSYNDDGFPLLNEFDELQKTPNIFIAGPGVRHPDLIFCFIYKFRLRFGVVALEIAKRLGKDIDYESIKKAWEKQGFFLDDFSSCGDECVC